MPNLLELGLSELEAVLYTTLLGSPNRGAQQLSDLVGVPRTSLYGALRTLRDKGLVEGGAGYGSKFRAVEPEVALPSLIDTQREELLERERIAKELVGELSELVEEPPATEDNLVEILRDRRVLATRFERLEQEAEFEIDVLVKAPLNLATKRGDPSLEEQLARSVRVRSIYETSVTSDPEIEPYLASWIEKGEEARVFPGELPCKLVLFDRRVALMPLVSSNEDDPVSTVIIHNAALGAGLGVMFDSLWQQSEPIDL